jgi:hypothetical protein
VTEAVTDALSDLAADKAASPSRENRPERANRRPASITHATLPPESPSAATQVRAGGVAARRR